MLDKAGPVVCAFSVPVENDDIYLWKNLPERLSKWQGDLLTVALNVVILRCLKKSSQRCDYPFGKFFGGEDGLLVKFDYIVIKDTFNLKCLQHGPRPPRKDGEWTLIPLEISTDAGYSQCHCLYITA